MEMGVIGNVAQDIADAHNATLAAERANTEAWNRSYHQVQSELAALKTKWDKIADEPMIQALRRADDKVQTLVDALKSYQYDENGHIVTWLSEAAHRTVLAKEGK